MDYHVFKKSRIVGGKKIHKWYYYYWQNGKQIQKVCKDCTNRSMAESYICTLLSLDARSVAYNTKIKTIAKNMFLPGSEHISRHEQLGLSVTHETLQSMRGYIEQIVRKWGNYNITELKPKEIMSYLFTVDRSGSWKNSYLSAFSEIFQEAIWFDCAVVKPNFQTFVRHSKKADIFTTNEIEILFKKENFPNEMMYLFFLLCLSAGMRLGEIRAVKVKQLIFDQKIMIIDGFCKKNGDRTVYNKCGSVDKPKLRIDLPDITLEKLQRWITDNTLYADDYCFSQNGNPIRGEYARDVFYRALKKTGFIPHGKGIRRLAATDGRKLVPHSLRYTYISRMRREMSAKDLRNYTGHTSTAMVDYYSRRSLELLLQSLPKSGNQAANTLFS